MENTAKRLEHLESERDAALHDACVVRVQNEQLRERLHQVIAERNVLQSR